MMYRIASILLKLMLLPLRTAQWLRRHREWLLTGMAMLAVMLISAGITLRFALHVHEVTVPELTGKTVTEASQGALASGVDLVIENRFYSTTVPAGRVLSQSPAPDTVVRHGWQVRVTESLGPQQVTIPNVVGETLRDASVDVRRDELDLGTLARVEAPGQEDMVLSQTPPPDAGVDQPRVNLLLSTAPAVNANAIVLPSFLGLTSAGAIRAASELGLTVGGVGDGPVVTAQAPGEGARVVRGDSVRVSLGGTSVAMPVVAAKAVTPAAATAGGVVKVPSGTGPVQVPAPVKPAANAPAKKAVPPPGPISIQIP